MALIKGFDLVGVRSGAQLSIEPESREDTMKQLMKLANEGKLRPHVSAEVPMERFKDAFTLMERKEVVGKCCITFGATSKL